MFEFTATIGIQTTIQELWDYLIDVKQWWPASNPEHIGLDILSEDETIKEGTPLLIREKIAGIPGEALGEIKEITPHESLTWQSDHAEYSFFGIPFTVKEGVTWQLAPATDGVNLSAHVWAEFPSTVIGNSIEWVFKNVLNGVQSDYEHAMTELRYLKTQIEH